MNPIKTQQVALDNALVPSEKGLKIEDAMLELHSLSYKRKKHIKSLWKLLSYLLAIPLSKSLLKSLQSTCIKLPSEDDLLSFIKELGYSGNCEMLFTIRTNQMHYPWRTFDAVINKCTSGKTTGLDMLREFEKTLCTLKFISKTEDYQKYRALIPDGMINQDIKDSKAYKTYLDYATGKVPPKKERKFKKPASPKLKTIPSSPNVPAKKSKRVKRPAKKSTSPTAGVVIRDTTEVLDEPTGKPKYTSEETGEKPGVPNVSKDDSTDSEEESDDVNDKYDNDDDNEDDDGGNDDGERTESNNNENPSFTLKDYKKEETQEDEYVHTLVQEKSDDEEKVDEEENDEVTKELYEDLNVNQEYKDADMTNFKQGPLQSSSTSSEFTSKLLNLDNPSPDINSLMDTSTVPLPPPRINPSPHLTTITPQPIPDSTTTTNPMMYLLEILNFASLFQFDQRVFALKTKVSEFNQTSQFAKAVSLIPDIVDNYLASKHKEEVNAIIKEQVQAKVTKILPQIEKYVTKSLRAEVLVRSTNQPQTFYAVAASLSEFELNKILIDKMETNESINRSDIQRNLYNALTKQKKSSKDGEPLKGLKSKESRTSGSSKGIETHHQSSDTEMQYDQVNEFGHPDDQPSDEAALRNDWFKKPEKPPTPDHPLNKRKYHFEECYKAVNDKLDWNNPEGHAYPFDLSKPLLLIKDRGRQVVPGDYFINNDLEYLKCGSKSSKYTTSTTRTKAARIIMVIRVKVMKWYDYGYLEEIEVRRDDNVLYKFKEGDFPRLNLCDIEDTCWDF
nr:hypothetical protein [Tanacetum cinerariifolium]